MKYRVNFAQRVDKGQFGPFGTLLVTPVAGKAQADKISIRTQADVADKVKAKIAEARKVGEVIVVEAEFTESETADGISGVREETWTNKDGQEVTQTALYLRFASTPTWSREKARDDEGNLDSL